MKITTENKSLVEWALNVSTGSARAKMVLVNLVDLSDGESVAVSLEKLAELVQCDRKTMQSTIRHLSDRKFVSIERHPHAGKTPNRYFLNAKG